MLEKMSDFFEARLDGYDAHMMTNIASAAEFYPFTAGVLPTAGNCQILDLGCGTGLELAYYLAENPSARITGIDLSKGMLDALREKFHDKKIDLICGSYFDVPLGEGCFRMWEKNVDSRAIIEFECGARCGNVVIRDIYRREEQATKAPLLKISGDTVIDRLVLENISQSAADGVNLVTIEIDGEVKELIKRDVIE